MENSKLDFWAIVSLFGHQEVAGYVTDVVVGGAGFVRIDVPETTANPAFTVYRNGSAVYGLDPCDELVARWKAERLRVAPVQVWEVRSALSKQLEAEGKTIVDAPTPALPDASNVDKNSEPLDGDYLP